jgi:hypothetical protein
MTKDTTKAAAVAAEILLFDDWFDAIGRRSRSGSRLYRDDAGRGAGRRLVAPALQTS